MDAPDTKPTASFSFSRPQDKSSLFHTRASTSFKTSNPDIFPSLNPFGSFIHNHKKVGDHSLPSNPDDLQGVPLKKTKSENSTINMFAEVDHRFGIMNQGSPRMNLLRDIKGNVSVKENTNKLSPNERENIKEYLDSFYSNEVLSEDANKESPKSTDASLPKEETERKESPELLFAPLDLNKIAKISQQEIYKALFGTLVREFEQCWKRQLLGLRELERWYVSETPFTAPLAENIHVLLLDRLSRKLKIEHETVDLLHKVQNVYEINQEYVRAKGAMLNNGKAERKVEKARVIVIDGNYDASNSKIGCKKGLQGLEDKGKVSEIKESA